MKRREFLKLTGLTGTIVATGCAEEPTRRLIPFLNPPEDIIPGKATWFATTCRQCPAGCGMLAKNRETRIIKFEGNPAHPINRGKLCARGHAALQDLYSPDRLAHPDTAEGWEGGAGDMAGGSPHAPDRDAEGRREGGTPFGLGERVWSGPSRGLAPGTGLRTGSLLRTGLLRRGPGRQSDRFRQG